jgi:beta-fructofuranosidase
MASEIMIENMDNENMKISFGDSLILVYDRDKQVFSMEFKDGSGSGRSVRRATLKELTSLDILIDHSIMEVYINGGFCVFTTRFYMENEAIEVTMDGVTGIVRKWDLEK